MKKTLLAGLLALSTLVPFAAEAVPKYGTTTYRFRNNRAGYVGVHYVTVTRKREPHRKNYSDTIIEGKLVAPKCNNNYYLDGSIYIKFTSSSGKTTGFRHVKRFTRYTGGEGQPFNVYVQSTKGLRHHGGRVTIQDKTRCSSREIINDRTPETMENHIRDGIDALRHLDPTRHF